MVKRTTINLDVELVAQAREALKAKNTTDTVHAALREVVRRDRLRRLSQRKWGMTLEELQEMRRSRVETKPWGKLVGGSPSDLLPSPRPREGIPSSKGSAVDRPRAA
jgi:Arc/MetJ family transcription regulator